MNLVIPDFLPPTVSLGNGRWRTFADWSFQIEGVTCLVPVGFVCDLYSVPFPLSVLIPRDERDNRPAMIHDWLYATVGLRPTAAAPSTFPRSICDAALFHASRQCGLGPVRSWSIHTGVTIGGWKPWSDLSRAGHSLANPKLN